VSSAPLSDLTDYAWAVPDFHPMLLGQIAAMCEAMEQRPPRFKYCFTFEAGTHLVLRGEDFVISNGSDGFTCSTFVLAVFHTKRMPLLRMDTWIIREQDAAWQRSALGVLRRNKQVLGVSDQDLAKREQEIPCLRFTPLDVIGSCRVGGHPCECEITRQSGDEVGAWIDQSHATRSDEDAAMLAWALSALPRFLCSRPDSPLE
jgi:hypothetical protein